jgi:hypothetical protein
MRLLVRDIKVQEVLTRFRACWVPSPNARVLVIPLEVALPVPPEDEVVKRNNPHPRLARTF